MITFIGITLTLIVAIVTGVLGFSSPNWGIVVVAGCIIGYIWWVIYEAVTKYW